MMWRVAVGPIWRLVVTLWVFGYALVDLTAVLQGKGPPGLMFICCLPQLALGLGLSFGLLMLLHATERWHPVLRWPVIAAAVLAAGLVQTVFDLWVLVTLAHTILPQWLTWADLEANVYLGRMGQVLILYVWTFSLILASKLTIRANDHAREVEARAAALEVANQKAEASMLRMQLNPHFMFNALNSVASLVVTGRERDAERMIGLLADFLRASLNSDPSSDVALEEELATLTAYLQIEEIRFGNRMTLEIETDPDVLDVRIPSLLLQPLAENAVKYGVAPFTHRATIRTGAREVGGELVLTVENRSGHRAGQAAASVRHPNDNQRRQGIGLANTRQRLAVAYGDAAWMTVMPLDDGFRVEIGLPLRRGQPR